jgi:hypothetical protein
MQHDFNMRYQTGDCIGSEFLTRRDVPVSGVSLVLQAGHSHRIRPGLLLGVLFPLVGNPTSESRSDK